MSLGTVMCEICGREIITASTGRPPKYCSECREKKYQHLKYLERKFPNDSKKIFCYLEHYEFMEKEFHNNPGLRIYIEKQKIK